MAGYFYRMSGHHGDDDEPPVPDLASLKANARRIHDLIASLVHLGDGYNAVADRRNLKSLREIEDTAVAIANECVNPRCYWEERR